MCCFSVVLGDERHSKYYMNVSRDVERLSSNRESYEQR
jgi:hypothetical protein